MARPKPEPEAYERAAMGLGIGLVFEDLPPGLMAARRFVARVIRAALLTRTAGQATAP